MLGRKVAIETTLTLRERHLCFWKSLIQGLNLGCDISQGAAAASLSSGTKRTAAGTGWSAVRAGTFRPHPVPVCGAYYGYEAEPPQRQNIAGWCTMPSLVFPIRAVIPVSSLYWR